MNNPNKKRSGYLVCLFLLMYAVLHPFNSHAQQRPNNQQPPSVTPNELCLPIKCDELLFKARSRGFVSIIVRLKIPFRLETELPPEAVQAQREAIANAQERLLARMATHKVTHVMKFKHAPDIAMAVDAAALQDLLSNPEISLIHENLPAAPALPQSGPLIVSSFFSMRQKLRIQ